MLYTSKRDCVPDVSMMMGMFLSRAKLKTFSSLVAIPSGLICIIMSPMQYTKELIKKLDIRFHGNYTFHLDIKNEFKNLTKKRQEKKNEFKII